MAAISLLLVVLPGAGAVVNTPVSTPAGAVADQPDERPDVNVGGLDAQSKGAPEMALADSYDLALVKRIVTAPIAPVTAGASATYEIVVRNQGTVPSGQFTVVEDIPAGMSLLTGATMLSAGVFNADTRTWTLPDLAVGAEATLRVTLRIDDATRTVFVNGAAITSDSGADEDSDPADANAAVVDQLTAADAALDNVPGDTDDHDVAVITNAVSYRIGNLVWFDADHNGLADLAETGIAAVTIELYRDDDGTAGPSGGDGRVAIDVTDSEGRYAFDNLAAGSYYLAFPSGQAALTGYVPSTNFQSQTPDDDADNDNNGGTDDTDGRVTSGPITDGGATAEPTDETTRDQVPADDDNDSFADERSNYSVDFGFYLPINLRLTKTLTSPGPYRPGTPVTYTITVTNDGPGTAHPGWLVTDMPPRAIVGIAAVLNGVRCAKNTDGSPSGPVLTCPGTTPLGPGSTATVTVTGALGSDLVTGLGVDNIAYVTPASSDVAETNPLVVPTADTDTDASDTDNDAMASLNVAGPSYDLALVMVIDGANPSPVVVGDEIPFRIVVRNQGQVAAGFRVTDVLPAGMALVAGSQTFGSTTVDIVPEAAGSTLSWSAGATTPLAPGAEVTLTYRARIVSVTEITEFRNQAEISADSAASYGVTVHDEDSVPDANPADDLVVDRLAAADVAIDSDPADSDDHDIAVLTTGRFDLALTKQVSSQSATPLVPGQSTVTFTIAVLNQGTVAATNVVVHDVLPSQLTLDTAATANVGWTVIADGTLQRTIAGPVAPGATATLTLVANVAASAAPGAMVNRAEIASADNDGDPSDTAPIDIDSTPDGNIANETNVVDDAIDNTGGDEDDHDLATANVFGYRLGNLVWRDEDRDGIADSSEPGIPGVRVEVRKDGVKVIDTLTDANGHYVFDNLVAGAYSVVIPSGQSPLNGFASSTSGEEADPNTNGDNNDNGTATSAAGVSSAAVTLGDGNGAAEPADETRRNGDPTDDDAGTTATPDDRSNVSVDFGFTPPIDLSLTKTVSPSTGSTIGAEVSFTLTVRNAANCGGTPCGQASGVEVTDKLRGGFSYVSDSGAGAYVAATGVWTVPGAIAPGGEATLTIVAEVVDGGSLRSIAQITSAPTGDIDSTPGNLVTPVPIEDDEASATVSPQVTDLAVITEIRPTGGATGEPYRYGDTLQLVVTITNNGPTDATSVTVGSQMPSGFSYVGDDGGGRYDPTTGTWTVGDLRVGQSRTVVITAVVQPGGFWTSEPSLTGLDQTDTVSTNNGDSDRIIPAPLTLGNRVWLDSDNDGIQDLDEAGVAGVVVRLLRANGTIAASTATNATGHYLFVDLAPGDYVVEITPAAGFASSTSPAHEPAPDADNNVDLDDNGSASGTIIRSTLVTLRGGEPTGEAVTVGFADTATDADSNLSVDFGLSPLASISGVAWHDDDADGLQDQRELGMARVTVMVRDQNGTEVARTTTDDSGAYRVNTLVPGTYTVEIVPGSLPGGVAPNSDVDGVATPNRAVVTVTVGQIRGNVDFGYRPTAVVLPNPEPPATTTTRSNNGILPGTSVAGLSVTGVNTGLLLGLAMQLFGAGLVLVLITRRTRRRTRTTGRR